MSVGSLFAWTRSMWKPGKGSAKAARVEARKQVEAKEDREKTKVRKRDGYRCAWPGCDWRERRDRIEVAHLAAKGAGGDHGLRSTADNLICLCLGHHQGVCSLHSGDLRIVPLTVKGTHGPVAFYQKLRGRWLLQARETACRVLERVW